MVTSPHRRTVLRLLAGLSGLLPGSAHPQDAPRDQGIGGTGAWPAPTPVEPPLGDGDRGIGGTGVIGTIRRFGSIVVNDLRIAYPADVAVRIDGDPATASALRIGHVVHVVARSGQNGLATRRIDVTSEVVGPVESAAPGRLIVLGQRVMTTGLAGTWTPGTRVAVSGLRRPDGVIVASLIETRPSGPDRVAGPVRREGDGTLMIGNLRLMGAPALTPGTRTLVTGTAQAGALAVSNAAMAGVPFPPGLWTVSIEAYIGRAGTKLELGSGLAVAGAPDPSVPQTGSVRAIVQASVAQDGALTIERLQAQDRIAPQPTEPDPPRFQYERDHLDLRSLPDTAPSRPGLEPGAQPGGPAFNTRPGGDIRMPGDSGPRPGPDFTPNGVGAPRTRIPGMGPGPGNGPVPNPNGPSYPGGGGPGGLGGPGNIPGFRR